MTSDYSIACGSRQSSPDQPSLAEDHLLNLIRYTWIVDTDDGDQIVRRNARGNGWLVLGMVRRHDLEEGWVEAVRCSQQGSGEVKP